MFNAIQSVPCVANSSELARENNPCSEYSRMCQGPQRVSAAGSPGPSRTNDTNVLQACSQRILTGWQSNTHMLLLLLHKHHCPSEHAKLGIGMAHLPCCATPKTNATQQAGNITHAGSSSFKCRPAHPSGVYAVTTQMHSDATTCQPCCR